MMNSQWNRRDVLKGLAAASTGLIIPAKLGAASKHEPAPSRTSEVHVNSVSPHTFRLSILTIDN